LPTENWIIQSEHRVILLITMRRKDNIPSLMVINRAVKWFKLGESSRRLDEVNYSVRLKLTPVRLTRKNRTPPVYCKLSGIRETSFNLPRKQSKISCGHSIWFWNNHMQLLSFLKLITEATIIIWSKNSLFLLKYCALQFYGNTKNQLELTFTQLP